MKKILFIIFLICFITSHSVNAVSLYNNTKLWGIKDDLGNVIVEPTYKKIIRVGEINFLVQNKKNKFGMINQNGDILVDIKYKHADRILGQYIELGNYHDFGLYDKEGKCIIPHEYDSLSLLFGKMILTSKNYHYGVMDFEGNILLENIFDDIYMPKPNIMCIQYEGKWYEIEKVSSDNISQPQIQNSKDVNWKITKIVEATGVMSGYSVVTFSDYLIKVLSSISPAHEQTIDELMLSQGADSVNMILKFTWLPRYPYTFIRNYYHTFANPNNGPFSGIKNKLKKHIT